MCTIWNVYRTLYRTDRIPLSILDRAMDISIENMTIDFRIRRSYLAAHSIFRQYAYCWGIHRFCGKSSKEFLYCVQCYYYSFLCQLVSSADMACGRLNRLIWDAVCASGLHVYVYAYINDFDIYVSPITFRS